MTHRDPLETSTSPITVEQLDPESMRSAPGTAEPAPWFGYIGLGIAVVAMLAGLVAVVGGVIYFLGWIRG